MLTLRVPLMFSPFNTAPVPPVTALFLFKALRHCHIIIDYIYLYIFIQGFREGP